MSATLGDVTELAADLTRRNGRETAVVDDAERPVPLHFSWALTPLAETLDGAGRDRQAPVYVVHFTQAAAVEHADVAARAGLRQVQLTPGGTATRSPSGWPTFRFGAGFGKTLSKLLRSGIGVHHAGMLPRYRRLVEQLAQAGLLHGHLRHRHPRRRDQRADPHGAVHRAGEVRRHRQRVLRTREFLQIAGRAGRRRLRHRRVRRRTGARARHREREGQGEGGREERGDERREAAKRKSKAQLTKPPEGTVVWTEQTFDKLVAGAPEPLRSPDAGRQRDAGQRRRPRGGRVPGAAPAADRQPRGPARRSVRLARRALRLARSLVHSGVLTRLEEPDEFGRRYVLTVDLPEDFALNQPLAHFALAALDVLDPESPTYTLDIVSVDRGGAGAAAADPVRPAARGPRRGDRGDEGRRHRVRRADGAARGGHLAEAAAPSCWSATYEIYRETPPVAARGRAGRRSRWCARCTSRGWASPTSSAATSSPAPRAWCCATSPTPTARCGRPCPTQHRHAGAGGPRRVAGGDRASDRLLAARRVGGADRPRPRAAPTLADARAAAAAAADLAAGAGVPGDDPQRDVAPGASWWRATTSTG